MCSNFEPIKSQRAGWLKQNLGCDLPADDWRSETFPTNAAPFVYYDNGQTKFLKHIMPVITNKQMT